MLNRIRELFYWAQTLEDVQSWCKSCNLCASRKGPPQKPRLSMCQYNVGTPKERIGIDVLGPLPETDDGNGYLLITVDYCTKWPEG